MEITDQVNYRADRLEQKADDHTKQIQAIRMGYIGDLSAPTGTLIRSQQQSVSVIHRGISELKEVQRVERQLGVTQAEALRIVREFSEAEREAAETMAKQEADKRKASKKLAAEQKRAAKKDKGPTVVAVDMSAEREGIAKPSNSASSSENKSIAEVLTTTCSCGREFKTKRGLLMHKKACNASSTEPVAEEPDAAEPESPAMPIVKAMDSKKKASKKQDPEEGPAKAKDSKKKASKKQDAQEPAS